MRSLDGARVLVVGASSGIGRAVARQLHQHGATVAVAARRLDLLDELVASLTPLRSPDPPGPSRSAPSPGSQSSPRPQPGPRPTSPRSPPPPPGGAPVRAFRCDVTDESACHSCIGTAADWLGGLDLVVNTAGAARLGALEHTSALRWHAVLSTNLIGAAVVARAAIPELRRSGGTIVLLSSHSAAAPWPGLVPYAAAKAGVEALARGLRAEEPRVRVVTMTVGPTATAFADDWGPDTGRWMERWTAEGYLRHRVLDPDEVATAVLSSVVSSGGATPAGRTALVGDTTKLIGTADAAGPPTPGLRTSESDTATTLDEVLIVGEGPD